MSKNTNTSTQKGSKSHKRTNSNSYSQPTQNTTGYNQSLFPNNNQTELISGNTNIGSQQMGTYNFSNLNMNSNINSAGLPLSATGIIPNNISENRQTPQMSQYAEEFKAYHQKVDCVGKKPTARFGHTVVLVNPVKIILFGGAVGDTRNFQFTNDTYVLNLITKIWLKLERK
jgi:hypothetical protein